jgi:NADH dehydrogenase
VELAGQIREVATKTLRYEYRHIKPEDAGCCCSMAGRPLTPFGPELSAKGAHALQARRRAAYALDHDRYRRHRFEHPR